MDYKKASNKLNEEFILKYSNVTEVSKKSLIGFKLVLDRVENFYSVGTGLYRYKVGRVKRRNTDYSKLYKGTEHYVSEMSDKISVFTSIEDVYKSYPFIDKSDSRFCIVQVTLTGDIIKATATNEFNSCVVYAGSSIDKIKRYENN